MTRLKQAIRSELIAGWSTFDRCFLLAGLLLQVIVFALAPERPIVIVSGLTGIISVVLCSKGKISHYAFGFVQVLTYLVIAWQQRLYGEVGINVFYFFSMIYGLAVWLRRYHVDEQTGSAELQTRKLSAAWWITTVAAVLLGSLLTGWLLATFTDDSDPYLDAFTTIPAIAGQLLMVFGYREQWFFWFCIDVGCVWLWFRAGNWSMAALYAFWCANCIRGFLHWTRSVQLNETNLRDI
ncbi:MAG: nicotinamide mononucleotide transporter [Paludibacteraceae bacterium]|nr:nicotinamide mononucleotide transporter [Paludibacteraceae bacterium]